MLHKKLRDFDDTPVAYACVTSQYCYSYRYYYEVYKMMEIQRGYGVFIPPDENITRFSTGHFAQRLTINDNFMMVEDPGVGDFVIQDPLMYALHTTPNAMRATAISQLCKNRENATTPNLWSVFREECVVAQYPMVEKFGAQQNLSREHINAIHIAVELPDQGHPVFSHLAEQAIQKWGGPENYHDQKWPYLAKLGGTTTVLSNAGVVFDEQIRVPGYKIPEWAERTDKRDLDVDNLQFIIAEGLRWFDTDNVDVALRSKIRDAIKIDNFEVTDTGHLAAKTPEVALIVAKLLMLFSTEHWNDPLNRAHMHLMIHGMQRSITTRRLAWMDDIDRGETRDPVGYYYGIDDDFTRALETGPGRSDDFIYLVSNTLNSSGIEERRRFVDYKLPEYARFMADDLAQDYPSQYLEPKRVEFGPKSSSMKTEPVELTAEQIKNLSQVKVPELDKDHDALTYVAGPLKNRFVDPLVRQGSEYKRLSEIDSAEGRAFKKLLAEHQQLQRLGVRVSFAFNPGYAEEFRNGMTRNDLEFNSGSVQRSEMTHDQRRRVIETGAVKAMALGQASGRLVLKRGEPLN